MKTSITPRTATGIHTEARPASEGAGSKKRFFGGWEPVLFDRLFSRRRVRLWRPWRMVAAALLVTLSVAVAVTVLCGAFPGLGGWGSSESLPGEVPPLGTAEEVTADTDSPDEATRDPEETSAEPPEDTESSVPGETDAPGAPGGSGDSDGVGGGVEADTGEGQTALPAESEGSEPIEDSSSEPRPDTDAVTEDGWDTSAEPPSSSETARPVPEGCYPIVPMDVSEAERGAGYIVGETGGLPAVLPRDELWTGEGMPTVLMVHTHPYEGYGDGKAWYDPASGSMALTDSAYASDGVVALGAALSRMLREAGVTVIHLRLAVSEEDSAADIYQRTEAAVRSYCALYPDIGLVLNLRRSAEMTEDGGILRTAGEIGGETCAQLRISVSGGRREAALGRDLAAALALRETLWNESPTVSRPVRVKSGGGMAGVPDGVCQLGLELGAAGNVFSEAERVVAPLAAALGAVLRMD